MSELVTSSRIAQIVDYTAKVAATIEGVKSIAAAGQGFYEDPLRPGQQIEAAGSNPTEDFMHWSELPTAPGVSYVDQEGDVELSWTIVMKLFIGRSDLSRVRQELLPFYDRYLAAFVPDWRLGGLVQRQSLTGFAVIGSDTDWAWLEVRLLVVENVTYPRSTQP